MCVLTRLGFRRWRRDARNGQVALGFFGLLWVNLPRFLIVAVLPSRVFALCRGGGKKHSRTFCSERPAVHTLTHKYMLVFLLLFFLPTRGTLCPQCRRARQSSLQLAGAVLLGLQVINEKRNWMVWSLSYQFGHQLLQQESKAESSSMKRTRPKLPKSAPERSFHQQSGGKHNITGLVLTFLFDVGTKEQADHYT